MKKIIYTLIFLTIILSGTGFVFSSGRSNHPDETKIDSVILEEFERGEEKVRVIIELEDEVEERGMFGIASVREVDRDEIAKSLNLDKKDSYENYYYKEISLDDLEILKKENLVKDIYLSRKIRAFLQESVPLINATPTWNLNLENLNLNGSGQTVCVIDTGVDFTHPDLIGKNLTCNIDCFNKSCTENCSILDDHGTHVAGIVGAYGGINGTAIGANLIGLKILDASGYGSNNELDLSRAIQWCIDNKENYNISVISMSLGTIILYSNYCDGSDSWTTAVNNASKENISIVVATGNAGNTTHISDPACIENSTRVGATNKNDLMSEGGWGGYNRWSLDMLIAPGISISSTVIGGGYDTKSGTSMATPHVSGAIAIIRQYLELTNRTMTPKQIENLLKDTGKQINDTEGNGLNYSRIDVYEAIKNLDTLGINFTNPTEENNSFLSQDYIQVNVSTNEENLGTITIRLYNETGDLINSSKSNQSPYFFNFTNIKNGKYFINASVNSSVLGFENHTNTRIITLDKPLLVISNIRTTNIKKNQVTFNATTNENATCFVKFGENSSLVNQTSDSENKKIHVITQENLSEGTFYYYKWNCTDLARNLPVLSEVYSFSTIKTIKENTSNITSTIFEANITKENKTTRVAYFEVKTNSSITNATINFSKTSTNPTNKSILNKTPIDLYYSITSNNLNESNLNWVIIKAHYNSSELPENIDESTLRLYWLNGTDWEEVEGGVNTSGKYVWGNRTGFSYYGIAGDEIQEDEAEENGSGNGENGGRGGGGGSTTTQTQETIKEITKEEIQQGTTETLSKNEKLKFQIKNNNHTLEIQEIYESSAKIQISSNPITLTIELNNETKIDLNKNNSYDLLIILTSIENKKVTLFLQEINKEILQDTSETNETKKNEELEDIKEKNYTLEITLTIIIIIIFISFILIKKFHKNTDKENKSKNKQRKNKI
jgi:serine protease AprX